jgi:hypothetical protein
MPHSEPVQLPDASATAEDDEDICAEESSPDSIVNTGSDISDSDDMSQCEELMENSAENSSEESKSQCSEFTSDIGDEQESECVVDCDRDFLRKVCDTLTLEQQQCFIQKLRDIKDHYVTEEQSDCVQFLSDIWNGNDIDVHREQFV